MWRHTSDMGAGKSISRSNARPDDLRCLPFGAPDWAAAEMRLYLGHQLPNLLSPRRAETGLTMRDQQQGQCSLIVALDPGPVAAQHCRSVLCGGVIFCRCLPA